MGLNALGLKREKGGWERGWGRWYTSKLFEVHLNALGKFGRKSKILATTCLTLLSV